MVLIYCLTRTINNPTHTYPKIIWNYLFILNFLNVSRPCWMDSNDNNVFFVWSYVFFCCSKLIWTSSNYVKIQLFVQNQNWWLCLFVFMSDFFFLSDWMSGVPLDIPDIIWIHCYLFFFIVILCNQVDEISFICVAK